MNETQSTFLIHLRKEAIKFSSAHMTVFSDGGKEPIHGHNYQVELSVELDNEAKILKNMISFQVFKDSMKSICKEWDEKVLIPLKCPYLTELKQTRESVDFKLCGKHYLLPTDETVGLPVDNISTETLATEFLSRLVNQLKKEMGMKYIHSLSLRIDESRGQGASVFWSHQK